MIGLILTDNTYKHTLKQRHNYKRENFQHKRTKINEYA